MHWYLWAIAPSVLAKIGQAINWHCVEVTCDFWGNFKAREPLFAGMLWAIAPSVLAKIGQAQLGVLGAAQHTWRAAARALAHWQTYFPTYFRRFPKKFGKSREKPGKFEKTSKVIGNHPKTHGKVLGSVAEHPRGAPGGFGKKIFGCTLFRLKRGSTSCMPISCRTSAPIICMHMSHS